MKKRWKKWRRRKNERTEKSTRREPVSRKKNTAERRNRQQEEYKKNTGKEIKKENKKDTEKGTWKSVTKERVYDPNGKVLVITYACVVLFLALAVYMGYFLQMKSEDVINNPYNARLDSFSDRIVRGSILASDGTVLAETTTG